LDFAFVLEFLAATSFLEPAEVCRTELKLLARASLSFSVDCRKKEDGG